VKIGSPASRGRGLTYEGNEMIGITMFQRLVLVGLAILIRGLQTPNLVGLEFAALLVKIAWGHHTEDQARELMNEWGRRVV
jgi:hypothetical protein